MKRHLSHSGFLVVGIWIFIFSNSFCFGQTAPKFPGRIKLLPGYRIVPSRGIDSSPGQILNDQGVTIGYDIGMMAGTYTNQVKESDIVWHQNEVINAHQVVLVFTKQKELTVSFPHYLANFTAKIRNERDMADVLLIVLTYTPNDSDPPE